MVPSNRLGWIGVDLGTHSVKLAQAVRTSDGVRLRRAAVIQRSDPWSENDSLALEPPDSSWPEMAAAIECSQFRGHSAACLLPMNVCELRGLKVPAGDEHERRAMIASELADDENEQLVPREFDYWELGGDNPIESAEGFNVNVMRVARPWIDQVAGDCQRAGLDCWAIDGTPLAIARAATLAARPRAGERLLAVDWGCSNTTLCIVGKGRPLYARRLHDCGFRKCLAAIESSLGVSLDQAKQLVDDHGVVAPGDPAEGSREIQAAITSATADVVASLVDQIQRTLRFVESQRRQQHPASLWLMGGGASVRNMGPSLSAALGLPVCVWSILSESAAGEIATGRRAALFGTALALSALAWRDA